MEEIKKAVRQKKTETIIAKCDTPTKQMLEYIAAVNDESMSAAISRMIRKEYMAATMLQELSDNVKKTRNNE